MSRLTKAEAAYGLRRFARVTVSDKDTRAQLLTKAAELGVLSDLEERAFLCGALDINFELEISLADLVQLAIDSGVDFDAG